MGNYARFEVSIFDRPTETYLCKLIDQIPLTDRTLPIINDSGLFPADTFGNRYERAPEQIEEWLSEDAADRDVPDDITTVIRAWLEAVKNPDHLAWPGGYTPHDALPFGIITLDY